jgi:hypothetical protein
MIPTKFRFIWPSGFRGDLKNLAYQKQELPVAAQFGNGCPDWLGNMATTKTW